MDDIKKDDVLGVGDVDPILKELYEAPKRRDKTKDKRKFSKIRNAINKRKKRKKTTP